MAYCKAKLNSSDDKKSPCFGPFWIGKLSIKTTINACKMTIKQHDKWKYINANPKALHLYGTIKLHKADKPIRPIVNWKNSPGYKLAVHLVKLVKRTIQLPNVFNLPNSEKLMHSLKQKNIQPNIKMCSFDI
jgi:hypothetical protein